MPGQLDKLTVKQAAFVEAYLSNGRNATAAYRTAYAADGMNDAAVGLEAHRLLRNPKIAPRVALAQAQTEARLATVAQECGITKERISRELQTIALASRADLEAWSAAGVIARVGDKRQALLDLAKLHGYVIEKRDVRVIKDVSDLTDDELAALEAAAKRAAGEGDGTRH